MDDASIGLLERFLDDSLGEAEAAELVRRLDSDPDFRREFGAALRMQGLLRARLDPDASCERLADVVAIAIKSGERSFDSRVMEEIKARGLTQPRRRWGFVAAAAVALVAVLAGILVLRGPRERVLLAAGPETVLEREGTSIPADAGTTLEPGDSIRTPRKGWASVRYADGTLIDPGAELAFSFEADGWEEAMQEYHRRMGWGPYRPAEGEGRQPD